MGNIQSFSNLDITRLNNKPIIYNPISKYRESGTVPSEPNEVPKWIDHLVLHNLVLYNSTSKYRESGTVPSEPNKVPKSIDHLVLHNSTSKYRETDTNP